MSKSTKPPWEYIPATHWQRARDLRRDLTRAERTLWVRLRDEKLGVKFRRQHPIGRFIADFFAADRNLVIELDGDVHESPEMQGRDAERDEYLASLGLRVLRYTNSQIRFHIDEVVADIQSAVHPPVVPPPAGGPLRGGEGLSSVIT